jgi:hypothetical protein
MKAWNSTLSAPRKPLKRTPWPKLKSKPDGKPRHAPVRGLKKRRTDTVGKLKIKLWSLCRQIIIKRHGNSCYTCPATNLVGSNLHIGHFISSSVCSAEMRYSLDNLRPQCFVDNIHRSGNWPAYEAHLIADGIDVEELKRRNQQTKGLKYDILFYRDKIAEYENLLETLK